MVRGYEEAAGQGLMAGINAAGKVLNTRRKDIKSFRCIYWCLNR